MDNISFMYGFADELEKFAAKAGAVKPKPAAGKRAYRSVRRGAGKGMKEIGRAGWAAAKGAAPYALLGGIPLYFGAKAISEGFGRGVSDDPNKRMDYER